MNERIYRVLILDTEPDRLLALQQLLEEANLDATITWNEEEVYQLLGRSSFDLVLIGDHPPELDAAAILQDLSLRGTCPPALILRDAVPERERDYFRRIGATEVLPKRDLVAISELVTKLVAPIQFKPNATRSEVMQDRSWQAAS
jgi:DNA-binding response OmpR family regulator